MHLPVLRGYYQAERLLQPGDDACRRLCARQRPAPRTRPAGLGRAKDQDQAESAAATTGAAAAGRQAGSAQAARRFACGVLLGCCAGQQRLGRCMPWHACSLTPPAGGLERMHASACNARVFAWSGHAAGCTAAAHSCDRPASGVLGRCSSWHARTCGLGNVGTFQVAVLVLLGLLCFLTQCTRRLLQQVHCFRQHSKPGNTRTASACMPGVHAPWVRCPGHAAGCLQRAAWLARCLAQSGRRTAGLAALRVV
jgi:hypothetical protein